MVEHDCLLPRSAMRQLRTAHTGVRNIAYGTPRKLLWRVHRSHPLHEVRQSALDADTPQMQLQHTCMQQNALSRLHST